MEAHDGKRDSGKGRMKRLYDELARILGGLTQDRREAFGELLHGQEQSETTDDSRNATEGHNRERREPGSDRAGG